MADQKDTFRTIVFNSVKSFAKEKGIDFSLSENDIRVEIPPKAEMGDLGIPMFFCAKIFKMPPMQIASEITNIINANENENLGTFLAVGPYVNVKLNKANSSLEVIKKILKEKDSYGSLGDDGKCHLAGQKVMIEFSSPNTNKPLHLGHLRNDALGESVSRILKKAGADVYKVDLINNRGIHICKSMLAYKIFHEEKGETPESLGMKGDHFVGQCYVEYDKYSKEHPEAQSMAEEMLVKWEAGDEETRKLWQTMNDWTLNGVKETYKRSGVSFDRFYFESETYLLGKEIINKGLEKGIFFKAEDGSVRIDITEAVGPDKDGNNQTKVLLRKDGTSVYITQDIGTAIKRHDDWAYNRMVYVVATEQIYHFKVLFYILKKLGYDWAEKLYHLSYGMVNLPSGRMKSREGTVVDADDLLDSLHQDALKAINERGREGALSDSNDVAEKVALAALDYYLLQATPMKDMLFNPADSLSFNGNTGPYLQYMGARISSILAKAKEEGLELNSSDQALSLLTSPSEWELIKALKRYPEVVKKSAETYDPSQVCAYLYEIAKAFAAFYRDCPIISIAKENEMLCSARLQLADCTLTVLKNAMDLVLVPFLDRM